MSAEATQQPQQGRKDYGEYMGWMYNQQGTYTFICGFTFTILTLLIINLPNPGSVLS